MCGKNKKLKTFSTTDVGSPPRVREKRIKQDTTNIIFRITPACAGKTPHLSSALLLCQDHPRVCGKNQKVKVESKDKEGSPPRVREKLF